VDGSARLSLEKRLAEPQDTNKKRQTTDVLAKLQSPAAEM
jgi:hypothetical protein